MVRKDILTSRERFGLLVIDERPDRCNVLPLITSHAADVARVRMRDYYTSGTTMAKAQISALEEYRHDAISFFSEVGIIAEALGSVFEYPDHDLPVLKIPVLTQEKLSKITLPDPATTKRLPLYLEGIDFANQALGDRIPILAYVPAPFTTGMMISAPDTFLMQTIREPDVIYDIMELSLQATIDFCDHIINCGGLPVIVDPLASSSVISPRAYEKFALPYERRLVEYLHRYDLDIILHICGETGPILDLISSSGADLVSVDKVDFSVAVSKLSHQVRLVGNFDTSAILFSSPNAISMEVKNMVRTGMKANRGYIAATGCEVPIHSPKENVQAFISAAKEVGWYWD